MDGTRTDEDRVLSLRLDIHVDRRPVSGRLSTEHGTDEHFVGWLGFFEALTKLDDRPEPPDPPGLAGLHGADEHRREPSQ